MSDLNSKAMSEILKLAKELNYTDQDMLELFNNSSINVDYPSKDDGFYIKTKNGEAPDYQGWAAFIIEEYKFFSSPGEAYIYDKTLNHYRPISSLELESILIETTLKKAKPNHYRYFINALFANGFKSKDSFKSTDRRINLKNGILDVKTNKLIPHSHEYFFTYCLSTDYDRDATCNEWLKFLERIFPHNPEYKIICAEIFGYILYGGDQWLHKAFVLYGEGRNGKSTFLHILQKLIGHKNFSSVSLANLNKPFSVVNLNGKLANITGESPSDKINAEVFKEATSGGILTGSKKFQDEFEFVCNARFIFACNEMPRFGENTVGMQERLYFVPFLKFFDKSERRGDMKSVLEKELSGILNWAINGLEILLDEKYLPETDATLKLLDEYNCQNDSVYEWAKENIKITKDETHRIKSSDIFNIYKNNCHENRRIALSHRKFGHNFRKFLKSFGEESIDVFYDDNNRVYKCIIFKTSTFQLTQSVNNTRVDIYQ